MGGEAGEWEKEERSGEVETALRESRSHGVAEYGDLIQLMHKDVYSCSGNVKCNMAEKRFYGGAIIQLLHHFYFATSISFSF